MNTKYEIIEIDQAEITVDVSLLIKSEEMFFNATQMAKPFGKKVNDFLRLETTEEYLNAIFKSGDSRLKNFEDLVQIKKGRYGGTFLHNELANVREGCTAAQLQELDRLQRINTGLIEIGMEYQERKEHLKRCHCHELILLGDVA